MTKFKAAIFDLDGTLLDTLETLSYYCNCTLEKYGLCPYPKEAYRYMVGDGAKMLVHRMLGRQNADSAEMFEKAYRHYIDTYNSDKLFKTEIYPGIPALLDGLRDSGIKTAVLSNKPHEATVPIIRHFFGENAFCETRGAMEGVPLKPDPEAALRIAAHLGVQPAECIYVGDTGVDMETGKRAGFYTVGVLWGFREEEELRESGADFIAQTPEEILKLL